MDNTTNIATAPMTRREAREIERRTGVRQIVTASGADHRHDTSEIARNEMAALLSVVPADLAEIVAPVASEAEGVESTTGTDAFGAASARTRSLTVRAVVPAQVLAARRARTVSAVGVAASVAAATVLGISSMGADAVAEPVHQADLLAATTPEAGTATTDPAPADTTTDTGAGATSLTPAPAVAPGDDTTVHTFDASAVLAAGEAVAPEPVATAASGNDESDTAEASTVSEPAADVETSSAPASASHEAPAPAPVTSNGSILSIAEQYIGVPYVFGGTTPSGFDCAGYVSYVLNQAGYHTSNSISALASLGPVTDSPQPGDLVIYGGYHIGFYAGPNDLLHAPYEGDEVRHGNMNWASHYYVSLHG